MTQRARQSLLLLLGLLLAACGTTVPVADRGVPNGDGLTVGQLPAGDTPDPGQQPTGSTQVGTPGSVDSPTTGTAGPDGAALPGSGGSGSAPAAVPGSSKAPIELGFIYTETGGVFLTALGLNGTIADGRLYANAMLKHVNARGGLAGHQVKPVFYNMDLTRTDPYAVWMQEICASWTQDHHVLAGQVGANSDFSLVASCLDKKKALFDNPSAWVRTQADYRKYTRWFEPRMITAERLADEYVTVPEQLGWFGKKPTIGLLVYDYPQSRQMATMLTAALRSRGFPAPVTFEVHMGRSTGDLGNTISQVSSAVLKFRAAGVDRVMSVAYPGAVTFFMKYAQSQNYFPRYALTSYEGLVAVAANASAEQLKDAVAVGWIPDADVEATRRPALNGTARLCKSIFSAAGIPPAEHAGGYSYCTFVLMLQAAAAKAPGPLDGDALRTGMAALGTGFQAAETLSTTFSPTRHDGVSAVRPIRFDSGCACWAYAGALKAVP